MCITYDRGSKGAFESVPARISTHQSHEGAAAGEGLGLLTLALSEERVQLEQPSTLLGSGHLLQGRSKVTDLIRHAECHVCLTRETPSDQSRTNLIIKYNFVVFRKHRQHRQQPARLT